MVAASLGLSHALNVVTRGVCSALQGMCQFPLLSPRLFIPPRIPTRKSKKKESTNFRDN